MQAGGNAVSLILLFLAPRQETLPVSGRGR